MALNIVRSTGIPAIARANAVRAFSSSPAVSMAARGEYGGESNGIPTTYPLHHVVLSCASIFMSC